MSSIEKIECSTKTLSTPLELHRNSALKMFVFYFNILINKTVVKSFFLKRPLAPQTDKISKYGFCY